MKPHGEAEGDEANRSARAAKTDRNVGAGALGATSAASDESHNTGQGKGLIEQMPAKTCMKMRAKLKERFRHGRGQNLERFIRESLNPLLRGWMNYFRLSETKLFAEELDSWIRRRLRAVLWRQWKRPATRYKRLISLGLSEARAHLSASNGRGPWFNSGASHMNAALPSKSFAALGLVSLLDILRSHANSTP